MTVPTDADARGGWHALEPPGLLRTMARAWGTLLVGSVLAGLLGFAVSSTQSPRYVADATLFLAAPGETNIFGPGPSRDFERHLLDVVEQVRSESVTTAAAEDLGPGWSSDEVRANLVVRPDVARNAIQLVGRAATAAEAVELTNAAARAHQTTANERANAVAEAAVDRLSSDVEQLQTTADWAQEQLWDLQTNLEERLDSLPLDERIRVANARLAVDPRAQALQRQRDEAVTELASLRSEARKIRIDASLRGPGVTREVLAAAADQVGPKPVRDAALAAALAFVLIAGIVWARAEYRPRRLAAEDAARFLGIPLVGRVPNPNGGVRVPEAAHPHRRLYDATAAAVRFTVSARGGTAVVVAGLSSSDDLSATTALNLALAGARDGQRVILVDGDLRQSRLTHGLGVSGLRGWSDGEADANEISDRRLPPYPMSTPDGTTLLFMPAGTRTRTPHDGGLSSTLERLRATADLIVTDAAPIVDTADSTLLSPFNDVVLVLLRQGSAAEDLEQARYRLGVASTPAIGVAVDRPRRGAHTLRHHSSPRNLPSRLSASPSQGDESSAIAGVLWTAQVEDAT